MDGLYFRVSTERQTTENQFAELLEIAERDGSGRDWRRIRALLAESIVEQHKPSAAGGRGRTVYRVLQDIVAELAREAIYIEQGRSGKAGSHRPLFEQMKRDAAMRKFDRLLVWKVSRLGRDMREVISSVYELADMGVTVIPVKSHTGPITSTLGKLLWAVQAWFAEMENDERSQTIRAGQARARAAGKRLGRPRRVFQRDQVAELRAQGLSWRAIAARLGIGAGTARRAYQTLDEPGRATAASASTRQPAEAAAAACQNYTSPT